MTIRLKWMVIPAVGFWLVWARVGRAQMRDSEIHEAMAAYASGRIDQAWEIVSQHLEESPEDGRLLSLKGQLLVAKARELQGPAAEVDLADSINSLLRWKREKQVELAEKDVALEGLGRLERQYAELKEKLQRRTVQWQELSQDNKRLGVQLQAVELDWAKREDVFQERIDTLTKMLEESQEQLSRALDDKKKILGEKAKLEVDLGAVLREKKKLGEEKGSLAEKVSSLETQIERALGEKKALSGEKSVLETKLTEASEENVDLAKALEKAKKEREQLGERAGEAEGELSAEREKTAKLEERLKGLSGARTSLAESVEEERRKVMGLESQLARAVGENETLKGEKERLTGEKAKLEVDLGAALREKKKLGEEKGSLAEKVSSLETRLGSALEEKEALAGEKSALETQVGKATEKEAFLNAKLNDERQNVSDLEKQLDQLKTALQREELRAEDCLDENLKIQEDRKAVLKALEEADQKLEKLQPLQEELRETRKNRQEGIALAKELRDELADIGKELQKEEEQKKKLLSKVKEMEKSVGVLEKELHALKNPPSTNLKRIDQLVQDGSYHLACEEAGRLLLLDPENDEVLKVYRRLCRVRNVAEEEEVR